LKITIDREDEATLRITTQLFKDEVNDPQSKSDFEVIFAKFNQSLKKIGKEISMPGFRPGTVPPNIIKSKYGKQVMWDSIVEIVLDTIKAALNQNNIAIIGNPLIDHSERENLDLKGPKDYNIVVFAGYIPSFEVDFTNVPEIKRYEISYDQSDVEREIRAWQAKAGVAKKVQTISLFDKFYNVHMKLTAVDALGNQLVIPEDSEIPENERIHTELEGGFHSWVSNNFNHIFFNKSVGTKYRMIWEDMKDSEGNTPMDGGNVNEKTKELFRTSPIDLELLEIVEITPHPLNKDLYKRILGENTDVRNEVQFMDAYKIAFADFVEQLAENRLKYEIFRGFVDRQNVKLPVQILGQGFVEEYKKNYPDHNEEQLNFNFNQYMSGIHKMAVYNQIIASVPDVEVSESSFRDFLKDNIKLMFMDGGDSLNVVKEGLKLEQKQKAKDDLKGTLHEDIINSMDDEELEIGVEEIEGDELGNHADDVYLEMMVNNLISSKDYDFQSNFNDFAENRILSYLIENRLEVKDENITYKEFSLLT